MIPINIGKNQIIPPRLLILGANAEITYYLATSYIEEIGQHWKYHTIHKKPHIAFAFNLNRGITSDVIRFLQDNNINYFFYDYDNLKSFDCFAGYRNIFIADIFWELNLHDSNDLIYHYHSKMNILTKNSSMVHVMLPDLIFEPNDDIYNVSQMANTKSEVRRICLYKFLSDLIEYYRKAEKMPVYRITYPLVFQHEETPLFTFDNLTSSIFKGYRNYTHKNIQLSRIERSVITFKDLANAIYLIYKNEIKNENYNISSNCFSSEKFICQSVLNKFGADYDSFSRISIDNSYIKQIGMKFLTEEVEIKDLLKNVRNYFVK